MKEVLDGARNAMSKGATRDDVKKTLNAVANAGSVTDALDYVGDAIDAVGELDNAQF